MLEDRELRAEGGLLGGKDPDPGTPPLCRGAASHPTQNWCVCACVYVQSWPLNQRRLEIMPHD